MNETCESHLSINAKQYVPFKIPPFTLLRHLKSFTPTHKTHVLRSEGTRTGDIPVKNQP